VVNIRLPYEPLYGKLLGVALHSRIGDVKLGSGNADDVLRIYFDINRETERIEIGRCGRHLSTKTRPK
jgi:hypothetical protein